MSTDPSPSSTVSVVIVNWNRVGFLRTALAGLRRHAHHALDIVVVDNGSADGSAVMVRSEFPEARLIALPENVGQCAGLNAGIEAARNDTVISLDNDAFVVEGSIPVIVEQFARNSRLAVLHGHIIDYDHGRDVWWWGWYGRDAKTYADTEFATPWKIAEGLCALRRSAVLGVGGFPDEYFIMEAGRDLAIRLVDAGYELRYHPAVAFRHMAALERVHDDRARLHGDQRMYYKIRNELWTLWKHYPLGRAIVGTSAKLVTGAVLMTGRRGLPTYFRAVRDAFAGLPAARRRRRPVSRRTLRQVEYSRVHAVRRLREVMSWYYAPARAAGRQP